MNDIHDTIRDWTMSVIGGALALAILGVVVYGWVNLIRWIKDRSADL